MNRDDLINALTKAGYHYKWSKYSNPQLYCMYQEKINNIKMKTVPIYHWFLQTVDHDWIEYNDYKAFLKGKKKYNWVRTVKIQVGDKYETTTVYDKES